MGKKNKKAWGIYMIRRKQGRIIIKDKGGKWLVTFTAFVKKGYGL